MWDDLNIAFREGCGRLLPSKDPVYQVCVENAYIEAETIITQYFIFWPAELWGGMCVQETDGHLNTQMILAWIRWLSLS